MSDQTLKIAREKVPNFSMIKWLSFGNGLIRPACASFRDSVANGEFYDNGFDALNEFLAPEAGRIAMQETIMMFLVKFCGYSAAESDTVRRGIAKKKGTEQLLPEIERRFIEFTTQNYNLSEEHAGQIIKAFIQIILDASAYAFSWNHSDSYSCIGYISGYLRYYYPYEFITSALNTFSDNPDKTASITEYAQKNDITISMPKWRISKGTYAFDKEQRIITKGLSSIKYMSDAVAEELYNVSRSRNYSNFIQVLKTLDEETSINTRQLDILIKIDFFSMFGNQRELMMITDMFYNTFKKGDAKKIAKEKVDGTILEDVIKAHSVGVTKSGGEAKSYTLIDIPIIMRESEAVIKSKHFNDLDDMVKVRNFADIMGYVGYSSGKEEDRRKLYVMDIFPVSRKRDNKQFGYNIVTKSIGSGIESRFTVFNRLFNENPIKKGDIIYCQSYAQEGAYYTMTMYRKIS